MHACIISHHIHHIAQTHKSFNKLTSLSLRLHTQKLKEERILAKLQAGNTNQVHIPRLSYHHTHAIYDIVPQLSRTHHNHGVVSN